MKFETLFEGNSCRLNQANKHNQKSWSEKVQDLHNLKQTNPKTLMRKINKNKIYEKKVKL